jgi:hypothetical protein
MRGVLLCIMLTRTALGIIMTVVNALQYVPKR